jgi:hypothetical protein
VKLPYSKENSRDWLRDDNHRIPVWTEQYKCWEVPHVGITRDSVESSDCRVIRSTTPFLDGASVSNSLMSAGICLYPVMRRNCFCATNSLDPTQRSRWSPPCQRFTFRQTRSTIENADSITFVLANVFRSCIGM